MVGVIVVGLVGIVLLVMAYHIGCKEKISLLHDYHYDKVSPQNKKIFCARMGLGLALMGMGLVVTACILALTNSAWSFLVLAFTFTVGLGIVILTEKKYNK